MTTLRKDLRRLTSAATASGTGSAGRSTAVALAASLLLAGCDQHPGPPPPAPPPPPSPAPTLPLPPVQQAPAGKGLFADVTGQAGIDFHHQLADGELSNIMESDGAGGVVFDYDGDGFPDLYLVNSGPAPVLSDAPPETERRPNRLYRNRGDGTFEDRTEAAGVAGHGFGAAAAAADYDNDGDTDLLVVNFGSLILFQNRGDGTFGEVTRSAGLTNDRSGISATFLDADLDGWLDLFVANYLVFDPTIKVPLGSKQPYPGPLAYDPEFNVLYRNRGDGTFEDISEVSGIRVPGHRAMSVTPLDYDLDGDPDLYVSNDGTANLLLRNDGKARFQEVALETGVGFNGFGKADGSMGACVGDADGDTLPDLLVTRFGNASLYLNSELGFFEDRIESSGILKVSSQFTGWGGSFLDFDNDGDLDIFIANGDPHFMLGMPALLLANTGKARFEDASPRAGDFFRRKINARGSGVWDYDSDGWPDLVINSLGEPAVLLHNEAADTNHFLTLRLEGTQGNRDGFGAVIRVEADGRTWQAEARCPTSYLFQSDPRLHFGLGRSATVDRIHIRWPAGTTQELTNVVADQFLTLREPGASLWAPTE